MSAAGILTALKIVLWNPLEWMRHGEVRTKSPIRWLWEELKEDNRHMRAYQIYSRQILHRSFITEAVVDAFKELAPDAKVLDLEHGVLAAEDITELAPFIKENTTEGAIPLDQYLQTMKTLCEQKNIKLQTLDRVRHLYKMHNKCYIITLKTEGEKQSIDDFLNERTDAFKDQDADIMKAHPTHSYISPKALEELLDAASTSSTCRKIKLSSSLSELPFVADFLHSHSYRIHKDEKFCKTYRKYSLI